MVRNNKENMYIFLSFLPHPSVRASGGGGVRPREIIVKIGSGENNRENSKMILYFLYYLPPPLAPLFFAKVFLGRF